MNNELPGHSPIELPPKLFETLPNGFTFEVILAKGGVFKMGSDDEEAYTNEKPTHQVRLPGFYIGKYPVAQALWKTVMGEENNPSFFQGNKRPVETVSWEDAQTFLQKLNELTGKGYRLPTEAEWEYAARGGKKSRGYKYAGGNKLKEVGWYHENSHGETKAVGQKKPNELGLYDMSGNVYEWCQDWFGKSYYEQCQKQGVVDNPQGPNKGVGRVIRGGSWNDFARYCRVAYRRSYDPRLRNYNVGFRLVLSLQSVG